MQPDEVVPLLSGDHEGRQAGRVDGQEDDGEQGPDGGHEPGRERPWAVSVDWNLKHSSISCEQLGVFATSSISALISVYMCFASHSDRWRVVRIFTLTPMPRRGIELTSACIAPLFQGP